VGGPGQGRKRDYLQLVVLGLGGLDRLHHAKTGSLDLFDY